MMVSAVFTVMLAQSFSEVDQVIESAGFVLRRKIPARARTHHVASHYDVNRRLFLSMSSYHDNENDVAGSHDFTRTAGTRKLDNGRTVALPKSGYLIGLKSVSNQGRGCITKAVTSQTFVMVHLVDEVDRSGPYIKLLGKVDGVAEDLVEGVARWVLADSQDLVTQESGGAMLRGSDEKWVNVTQWCRTRQVELRKNALCGRFSFESSAGTVVVPLACPDIKIGSRLVPTGSWVRRIRGDAYVPARLFHGL